MRHCGASTEYNRPTGWLQLSREEPCKSRLASLVRTDQSHTLAGAQLEARSVHLRQALQ